MAINRRRLLASSIGASVLFPILSFAQTDANQAEVDTQMSANNDSWEDMSEHAMVHQRLRSFLSSAIGRSKDDRLEIAASFLSQVDPIDPTFVLAESAAYGILVRGNPIRKAISEGYHRSSKEGLLFAISEYPASPWTALMNSAWHFEVIRRSTIGASVMGASASKGQDFMTEAFSSQPEDPGLYLAAAISLLSEKPKKRADQARNLIDIGIEKLDSLSAAGGSNSLSSEYIEIVQEHTFTLQNILQSNELSSAKEYVLEIF